MSPEQLLKHFEIISEAPDAIPRLRRFILDLAVRGKLVEQDPNDEPASELLKRIEVERRKLDNKQKGQPKKTSHGGSNLVPVLRSWRHATLLELSKKIHYGYTASADPMQTKVRLLRITDIQNNFVNWKAVPGCVINSDQVAQYKLEENDILVARTGGTVGKTFLVENISVVSVFASYLIRIQPSSELYAKYLKLFMESSSYWRQLIAGTKGTGQPNVNGQTLGKMIVCIPPIAEQHRIVAKVNELMALCDELEAAQKKRESRRDRLVAASLHHLTNGDSTPDQPNTPTQKDRSRFYLNHLPTLTTRPEHIKQLRQTILDLAVRGKLVPQDPNDELASELLKRIEAERNRMVEEKIVKKISPQSELISIRCPFAVPKGWVCVPLYEMGFMSGGMTPSMNRSDFWDGEIPWFSPKDMKASELIDSEMKITASAVEETRLQLYPPGCLFIVARSGILKRILPVSINRTAATVNQDLKVLRPFLGGMEQYLQIMFLGMTDYILSNLVKTGTTVQSLKYTEFEMQECPLPPIAEQHRIVAKVNELMALCDKLEHQILSTTTISKRLLEATLAEALG